MYPNSLLKIDLVYLLIISMSEYLNTFESYIINLIYFTTGVYIFSIGTLYLLSYFAPIEFDRYILF